LRNRSGTGARSFSRRQVTSIPTIQGYWKPGLNLAEFLEQVKEGKITIEKSDKNKTENS